MKRWNTKITDKKAALVLQKETGLSAFLCNILTTRGIKTSEQAQAFLGDTPFSDPFLIEDMGVAVELIQAALENGTKITVFGDYDCDGVTATVILYSYLDAVGGNVNWYIPSREEGYGMNIAALDKLIKQGTQLVITVDNGISAVDEAKFLKQHNIPLIITDHHRPPEILPEADAIINPHRMDDISPFKDLCGAGVALKLAAALEDGDMDSVLEQYSEFAALGTVADVMPLVGENRKIVTKGLVGVVNTENIGLIQLLQSAGIDEDGITAQRLAFSVCPRINAAGRYDHAGRAVELFLCESIEQARMKSEDLNALNRQRQEAELGIIAEIEKQISENPDILKKRVLIFSGEGWHHGIIGIVSARILERYGKPNMIISIENGVGRASARSLDGFSLHKALTFSADLLIKFGGHTKAAGFSIAEDKLALFRERIDQYAAENHKVMPNFEVVADMELSPNDLTIENIESLDILEPFGEGNPEPVFLLTACRIQSKRALKEGRYTSFEFAWGGKIYKALCFSTPYDRFYYDIGDTVDIIGVPQINEYRGVESIIIRVKDMRQFGFEQDKYFSAKAVYESIALGEDFEKRLATRIVPSREDIKIAYDLVKSHSGDIERLELLAIEKGMNICKFNLAIDTLAEFDLVIKDLGKNTLSQHPSPKKADLSSSVLLNRLNAISNKR